MSYTLNTFMPRVCYTHKTLKRDVNSWFKKRSRCFLYHYPVDDFGNPVEEHWQNLNKIPGCCFHGWVRLADRVRGELWTFKTAKHRMLIQMQVDPKQLMFKEHFEYVQKELRVFRKRLIQKQIHLIPDDFIIF